jgi:hypothetical protein
MSEETSEVGLAEAGKAAYTLALIAPPRKAYRVNREKELRAMHSKSNPERVKGERHALDSNL